ncbi:unnamed protein product, partial [marine sediment metagenome]
MFKCPYCPEEKNYKSRFWFDNHLLMKHFKLFRKKSLVTYLIDLLILIISGIIVGVIIYFMFYNPTSWYCNLKEPQMRIDFYDKPKFIEGNYSVYVELSNEGCTDLHNIKASLKIKCMDGFNKDMIDYGTSEFDKPSYHLFK